MQLSIFLSSNSVLICIEHESTFQLQILSDLNMYHRYNENSASKF